MTRLAPWGNARPSLTASVLVWGIRARLLRGGVRRIARRVMSATDPYCDIEVGGIKMRCHLGDNWTETLLFEKGVQGRGTGLARLLNTLEPGFVVVDIGANCGAFTLFAAKAVATTGRVISIEPMPAMLDRLRFNARANGFTNITILETAVGAGTGTAELHVRGRNHGESTLVPNGSADRVLQVPVATLADLVAASGVHQLDALKIDIEGFEDVALLPYVSAMPRVMWPKQILIEVAHSYRWQTDCIGALLAAGYEKSWGDGRDCLLTLNPDAQEH